MEPNLQKMIVKATKEVFDTMIFMPITPGDPLKEKVTSFECHISAILGFAGDIKGAVTIHCPDKVAMAITGAFLGLEVDSVNDDVKDALRELTNMITGGIKNGLAVEGKTIKLSIPTTIGGKAYTISCISDGNWGVIPFAVEEGSFLVEFKFKTVS